VINSLRRNGETVDQCLGDFGCHGLADTAALDVCQYKCKGICEWDTQCKWTKNGCAVDSERRSLLPSSLERDLNSLNSSCIAVGEINSNCDSSCESGCCECCSESPESPGICVNASECSGPTYSAPCNCIP